MRKETITKILKPSPVMPITIELDFSSEEEFRKLFYRRAAKQIAEYMLSNGYVMNLPIQRNIMDNSNNTWIKLSLKIFATDTSDPSRLPN